MSNILNLPPNNKSGLYKAPSHAEGGVQVIVDGVKKVEVEGDEFHLCHTLFEDKRIFEFKDKTNLEILTKLFRGEGCLFTQGFAESNDIIICKKAVYDPTKRSIKGNVSQIVNTIQLQHDCKAVGDGTTATELKEGGKLPAVKKDDIDPEVLEKRWNKKKEQIEIMGSNLRKLRYNVTTDLKSEEEKVYLTALVVAIMLKTSERVGNETSEKNGHYGITGLRKKHVKVDGNKITLIYKGKSGVEHEKSFSDEKIATVLKKAIDKSPNYFVFNTSDGFRIKADRVNRILSELNLRSKDIRGYNANNFIVEKLKNLEPEEKESKRKRQFNKILRSVAEKVGHGAPTLRKHYMIPELETTFITTGTIIDITDRDTYEDGGAIEKRKERETKDEKIKSISVGQVIDEKEFKSLTDVEVNFPITIVGDMKFRKVFIFPRLIRIK
jgi:hypothetical protein